MSNFIQAAEQALAGVAIGADGSLGVTVSIHGQKTLVPTPIKINPNEALAITTVQHVALLASAIAAAHTSGVISPTVSPATMLETMFSWFA
jgi:hypothetical protein